MSDAKQSQILFLKQEIKAIESRINSGVSMAEVDGMKVNFDLSQLQERLDHLRRELDKLENDGQATPPSYMRRVNLP